MSLTAAEQRVCGIISGRHAAMVEQLRQLVNIPTGPGSAGGLDETRGLLTERLAKLGAAVELVPGDPKPTWLDPEDRGSVPPTAVCRRPRTTPHLPKEHRAGVLLCGHLDTVHHASSSFRELSISPDGRTATGPGCVDMKGGLLVGATALEALEEAGVAAGWGFIMNSDEETGSYHSDTALQAEAKRGYREGLVLEPAMADGGLVTERPGSGQFMIETRGRASHVGRDFGAGVSAVNALAACILRVSQLVDTSRGRIVNIGPLQGGVAANVVPDLARAWGNVRFPTYEAGEELGRALEAMETAPSELPGVKVYRSFNRPAKPRTPQVDALAIHARWAAEALGQQLPFGKTGGVCDGNNLQAAGLPTIDTLGVRGGGLHTPQEWIELASLVERAQLLAVLIMRLSQ
ncbi:MAG TPA: M20/M25/M40 family metallo-hydrolase [Phycisphaerales bacterium]|nr:M20/M25/M40 family metallo-hydrolase [Phycisphaerales bacterium]